MKNKNKAKGALVVGFALTLPMYLGVTFSIIFGSLMLHDEYVLQTTTQNLAREFAIDAASTVQTNAQTGIVYGNAINSILKYRKTLDDKLYLYKTTNEKGKQCTISIECNARNVHGSVGSGQTYNMYKLDSAYIVLKGKIVPKKDMIPQLVQPICPNLLDIVRKTRVELNINASLISKMDFTSEGGSAEGILHSEEYTADYGDYDLSQGANNGDTSVDNTPELNPINSFIQTDVLPDVSKLAGYSSSYRNAKDVIEAKDFESLLYDLLNEDALNKILWDRLIGGNDIPNLINDLYKLGLLQTNKIDFLYSIYSADYAASNWGPYTNEYLKNYFDLGPDYTFATGSMKLLTISKENKSTLAPDTPSLVSLLGLSDDVDLTMGNTLATNQYLIGQVTVTNKITGAKEVYNVVFKAGDELSSIIMQDYVAGVQVNTNNGLQMSSVGEFEKNINLPDKDGGTYWKESNRFLTDAGVVNADQYEGLYKATNGVYYELNEKVVIEQAGVNKFDNVYYDQTNTSSPAYTKVSAKVDGVTNNYYIPLDNVASGVAVESNNWNRVYCDLTGTNQGMYANVTIASVSSFINVNNYSNPVAYDSSNWKGDFYIDGKNNNEGVYLKVNGTIDGVKADRYFKLADVNAGFKVSDGSNWVKNDDGTYRDDAGIKTGNYVNKDGLYYLVDSTSSPAAASSGSWYGLYRDINGSNAGVYVKIGNDLLQVNTNESVRATNTSSAWTEMRYDSTKTNEGLYRYLGNAYYKVADNVVENVVQNNTTQWTNLKVDTKGVSQGLYIGDQSAFFQVKNPNVGITNETWINSSTTNSNLYIDANNSGNTGTYAIVNGTIDGVKQNYYYKLKDAASDIGINTPAANALTFGTDNIRVGSDGKKYALVGNSYYELADDANPLTVTDGTWKSAVYDTRRPHAYDDRTYYKNTIKINGVNVDYFTEIAPVGVVGARDAYGKLLNENECWNLIYSKGKVTY